MSSDLGKAMHHKWKACKIKSVMAIDAAGNLLSEMRYCEASCGQTLRRSPLVVDKLHCHRAAYALTKYTLRHAQGTAFTGQYSHIIPVGDMDDPSTSAVTEGFGLMFYQSRFYDPA